MYIFLFLAAVGNLSSSTTTTSTSISISGIQCEFEAGVDYNGFNILQQLQPKVGTVNSAEECSVECQKRAECSHFTFIWNACWLKRSAEGRTAAPSGISGTCFRHPTSSETCRVQTLLPEAVADGGYAAPTWELYQPLPADLSEVAAALVNGDTLLVVGTSHTYQGSAATYAYNLADSEWTTVAPRPFMGSHHASVAVGDDVYLFGGIGYGSQSAVQVYNVAANKWAVRPTSENIPYGQMIGSASSVKHLNEIFVCGGLELAVGLEGSVSACAAYTPPSQNGDAKHGAWRSIASMLVAVNHHAAGTDGSRMYAHIQPRAIYLSMHTRECRQNVCRAFVEGGCSVHTNVTLEGQYLYHAIGMCLFITEMGSPIANPSMGTFNTGTCLVVGATR